MENKFIKITTFAMVTAGILSVFATAQAVKFETKVVDLPSAIIHVGGETTDKSSQSILVVFRKSGIGDDYSKYDLSNSYIKEITSDSDGKFELDFYFGGPKGTYDVSVTANNSEYECTTIDYATYDDVQGFLKWLAEDPGVTVNNIYTQLAGYETALGMNKSYFGSENEKNRISNLLFDGRDEVKKDVNGEKYGTTAIGKIYQRYLFLKDVAACDNRANIQKWFTDGYADILGLDFSEYTSASFSEIKKRQALDKIVLTADKNFNHIKDFQTLFNKIITEVNKTQGIQGDGSSGGSSSGGGPAYSTPGGISAGPQNTVAAGPTKEKGFKDLNGFDWAKDAIEYLRAKGIIHGITENEFAPGDSLTRAQAATITVLGFNCYEEAQCDFEDVDNSSWAYKYIASALKNGIVFGKTEKSFAPEDAISRQDAAVMLYRAAVNAGLMFEEEKSDFSDWDEVSDYAKEAVSFLAGKKILNGYENGQFRPKKNVNRAEIARMLYLLVGEE